MNILDPTISLLFICQSILHTVRNLNKSRLGPTAEAKSKITRPWFTRSRVKALFSLSDSQTLSHNLIESCTVAIARRPYEISSERLDPKSLYGTVYSVIL